MNSTTPINNEILSSLRISKIFRDNTENKFITSIDYDDRGEYALTSSEDESLHLYDCKQGRHVKVLYSKKYGVHLARFTHRSSNAIYASTKCDDTIRYLSLHDNQYLRYFKGHKRKVVSLEVSPLDDQFISGALDDTVRLWDLRSPTCQGLVGVEGRPCVGFDQSGLVFAIALYSKLCISLYDVKNYDKEPFLSFTIKDSSLGISMMPEWTSIQFNNTGKLLLVTTAGGVHYVMDGYEGTLVGRLIGHKGLGPKSGQEACWTPDGRFVISGSGDGKVCIWDVGRKIGEKNMMIGNGDDISNKEIIPIQTFEGHSNSGACCVVNFNPRHMMMTTSSKEVAMWIPEGTI